MPWPDSMFDASPQGRFAKAAQDEQIAERDAVFASLDVYERARAECYRRSGTTPAGSSRGWPYDR